MSIYAGPSRLLARQLVSDIGMVIWVIGWWFTGRAVHAAVAAIAAPGRAIAERADQMSDAAGNAAEQVGGWPAIGEAGRVPFDQLNSQLGQVAASATEQVAAIERTATISGLVVFAIPVLVLAVSWLAWRLRFVRLSSEARVVASRPGGTDLLALRALTNQPLRALLAVDADPLSSWRAGDPAKVEQLADLELARLGLAKESPDRERR